MKLRCPCPSLNSEYRHLIRFIFYLFSYNYIETEYQNFNNTTKYYITTIIKSSNKIFILAKTLHKNINYIIKQCNKH